MYYTMGKKNKKRPSTEGDFEEVSDTEVKIPKQDGEESDRDSEPEMTFGPQGTLCEDYELRVRPMIDLIDRLRRIGLDKDVGLPSIVVVGDQSAGKSSVLEAISGIQLPRGSGIVTRCPLELRLKRSQDGPWRGKIHYKPDDTGDVDFELDNPEEVGQRVREAQDALAGPGKSISEELITLEIEAPGLPDLTLIDLPGIVRVTMKGQADNTAEKIKNLIRKYVKKNETIILAVVPANVDIETTEALAMANEVDPHHIRTLGVITKTDMVDRGAEDGLISVLLNERIYLKKGYIAVKCRGQQAIKDKQTLQQALQDEENFFATAEHFEPVKEEMYGIRSLSSRLTDELVEQVHRVLPDLKDDVFKKRNAARQEMFSLGSGIPLDPSGKSRFLMELLTKYVESLTKLAEGRENTLNIHSASPLHNTARESYLRFAQTIQTNVNRKEISGTFRTEVREAMENDRGRELPRFIKYETFKNLAARIVSEFDDPSRTCLSQVADIVHRRLGLLAHDRFKRFPVLEARVKGFVSGVVQEAIDKANGSLSDLFEMEALIFSQDKTYNERLDDIIKKKVDNTASVTQKVGLGFLDIGESKEKEVETMFTVLQAYMQIAVARVSDHVPMIIMQHIIVKVVDTLKIQVMSLLEPNSGGLETLREEKNLRLKREMLDAQLTRLDEAAKELQNFNPV